MWGVFYSGLNSLIFFPFNRVESISIIYKYIMNINNTFIALFNNLPYHEDIVSCGSIRSESGLIVT